MTENLHRPFPLKVRGSWGETSAFLRTFCSGHFTFFGLHKHWNQKSYIIFQTLHSRNIEPDFHYIYMFTINTKSASHFLQIQWFYCDCWLPNQVWTLLNAAGEFTCFGPKWMKSAEELRVKGEINGEQEGGRSWGRARPKARRESCRRRSKFDKWT